MFQTFAFQNGAILGLGYGIMVGNFSAWVTGKQSFFESYDSTFNSLDPEQKKLIDKLINKINKGNPYPRITKAEFDMIYRALNSKIGGLCTFNWWGLMGKSIRLKGGYHIMIGRSGNWFIMHQDNYDPLFFPVSHLFFDGLL